MSKRPAGVGFGWGARSAGKSGGWGAHGFVAPPPTQDLNVVRAESLVSPRDVKRALPMTAPANRTIVASREVIKAILSQCDRRLLAIVGPCSIHDEGAALEYANRLAALRQRVGDQLYLVMRVYFEKPRTTVGWKGLIYDPNLDGTFDMEAGIRKGRRILLSITEMGVPTGTEMLDPISPQYIADLISWSAIGARTTESQTHRQMASGLSMPVGFKNGTDGNLQIAIDALGSSRHSHGFLGIDEDGQTAIIRTRGNPWGHVILRGGKNATNYDASSIAAAAEALRQADLPSVIMVDCSHANAAKQYRNQSRVWRDVVAQRLAGNDSIVGMMLESNLVEGNQSLGGDPAKLRYGVSITDECIGWDETEALIREAAAQLAG
ncbi:MAG: 3-deoxy-7-phosphoheptulonate synthase [Phycisphaerae bacterium]|nr:3-deoxy-7-phosphoheptulonate synthase [Phycisphaerae bacterium]